jgi:hypothetical protein
MRAILRSSHVRAFAAFPGLEQNAKPAGAAAFEAGIRRAKSFTCQPHQFAVISDLPIKRLTRTTRKGQSKLAAEQGSFAGDGSFHRSLQPAKVPIGRASPE